MMEVVVTTGAIGRAKVESICYHQQTNIQLLQAGQPTVWEHWSQRYKIYHLTSSALPHYRV